MLGSFPWEGGYLMAAGRLESTPERERVQAKEESLHILGRGIVKMHNGGVKVGVGAYASPR